MEKILENQEEVQRQGFLTWIVGVSRWMTSEAEAILNMGGRAHQMRSFFRVALESGVLFSVKSGLPKMEARVEGVRERAPAAIPNWRQFGEGDALKAFLSDPSNLQVGRGDDGSFAAISGLQCEMVPMGTAHIKEKRGLFWGSTKTVEAPEVLLVGPTSNVWDLIMQACMMRPEEFGALQLQRKLEDRRAKALEALAERLERAAIGHATACSAAVGEDRPVFPHFNKNLSPSEEGDQELRQD